MQHPFILQYQKEFKIVYTESIIFFVAYPVAAPTAPVAAALPNKPRIGKSAA